MAHNLNERLPDYKGRGKKNWGGGIPQAIDRARDAAIEAAIQNQLHKLKSYCDNPHGFAGELGCAVHNLVGLQKGFDLGPSLKLRYLGELGRCPDFSKKWHWFEEKWAEAEEAIEDEPCYRLPPPAEDDADIVALWDTDPEAAIEYQLAKLEAFPLHLTVLYVSDILTSNAYRLGLDADAIRARFLDACEDVRDQIMASEDPVIRYPTITLDGEEIEDHSQEPIIHPPQELNFAAMWDEKMQDLEECGLPPANDNPQPESKEDILRAVIERLAVLDAVQVKLCAEEEAKALTKRFKTKFTAHWLTLEVNRARKAKQEEAAIAADTEAREKENPRREFWPHPLDGGALLAELVKTFKAYVIMSDAEATAAALWVLMTHTHNAFVIAPYLAAVSPIKGCGKSTLMSLLGEITANAIPVSSITAAAVYRSVEKWKPTLLMDEADKYLGARQDLQGIINSAHNQRNAYAVICIDIDGEYTPKKFLTWTPIALAWKGAGLPDTIDDRSIPIRLRKKLPSEKVTRFRSDRVEELQNLERKCATWAADHMDALREKDPSVPDEITNDRHADNWRTLLSIAEVIGGEWPAKARKAAMEIEKGTAKGGGITELSIRMLADIRRAFAIKDKKENLSTKLSADLIIARVSNFDENPWLYYGKTGRQITGNALGVLLRPFKISSEMDTSGTNKGKMFWHKADFEDAWKRYLPPEEPAQEPLTFRSE